MAADVAPAERHPATPSSLATAPLQAPSIDSVIASTHGDPEALAARLVAMHRADDPEVWTTIHQQLGNTVAVQTRTAIDRLRTTEDVLAAPVERTVYGVTIVAQAGVRAAAVDECVGFVTAEVGKNEYAQQKFAKAKVAIVIVPAKTKMTDVPAFEHLRGGKTFDGRDWSTVRGSGGMATPDGRFAIAIAEESIVQVKDVVSSYPATYSVGMHELAHTLESKGMSDEQRARIKELYAAHSKRDPGNAHDTFTDGYAADNEQEYFAQSTDAFFDKNVMGKNHSGKAWLQANDPDMYQFLLALYTIPHDAKGAARP